MFKNKDLKNAIPAPDKQQVAIDRVRKILDEANLKIQVVHQVVFTPRENDLDNKTTPKAS